MASRLTRPTRHIGLNPIAKHTFEAIEELDKTDLEYTRVANGWFSDYYGLPHWRTHLHPWINVVSMEKKWAAIPGDGSARANFITTRDFGKFFGRLMDLEKWCKISIVVGDELSLNELVELAEKTRGSSPLRHVENG